jgi:alpha-glucoside transport system substrate-binding protein
LDRALAGEFSGQTVTIAAQWQEGQAEAVAFDYTLEPFRQATGIDVQFQPTPNYEPALQTAVDGGNAPDLAQIAQPGKMVQYANAGKLVNLSEWFNTAKLEADILPTFVALGQAPDGTQYGIYYKVDVKSIVWYPVKAFADAGYTVPTTWDELTQLSDQIVADGASPWCIGIAGQGNAGWVATDWMEDILLRTAPIDTYNQWVSHGIAFNDPAVLNAAQIMHDIWFKDGYVYGGNTQINQVDPGAAPDPMFADGGAQCYMHKQAGWITGFFGTNNDAVAADPTLTPDQWPVKPQVDFDFFYFPPINEEEGRPVLGGADMFVMFNQSATGKADDRGEVRALLEWLATPEAAAGWIEKGGFLSPNINVPLDSYAYPQDKLAQMVQDATALGFDASDSMPAEVGNGTFWSGMVDWVTANGDGTEQIFQDIENSWPAG